MMTDTLPALTVIDGGIVDSDAIEMGARHGRIKASVVASVLDGIGLGHQLLEKKASMLHGQWLPWFATNRGTLGFSWTTAKNYMKVAKENSPLAGYLDEDDAIKLSRQMWGHKGEGAHVSANSGENEWYTPPEIIEAARALLGGFDLDPASSEVANKTVKAERFFTADDDGLAQDWGCGRIWMNPPYSQPLINDFCQKFAGAMNGGATGIALVNNATETAWFQMLGRSASAICFPQSRIKFLDPDGLPGAPLQGQAIIYSGTAIGKFVAEFSGFGFVMESP